MGFLLQLRLLLWKNFTLRKRQPVRVVVEIVWPLVLFIILVAVRFRPDTRRNIAECHYTARAMPSAGTLPFIFSFLCNFNNECKQNISKASLSGIADGLNDTILDTFVDDIETILFNSVGLWNTSTDVGNRAIRLADMVTNRTNLSQGVASQNMSVSSKTIDTILDAPINLQKVLAVVTGSNRMQLENLVTFTDKWLQFGLPNASNIAVVERIVNITCSDPILFGYLDFENVADATAMQAELCNLSLADANLLVGDIYADIDRDTLFKEVRRLFSQKALTRGRSPVAPETFFGPSNIFQNSSLLSTLSTIFCAGNKTALNLLFGSYNNEQKSQYNDSEANVWYGELENYYETNGISSKCAAVFASFSRQTVTKYLWWQFQPIVLGVINYAPDTPATRKIIKEANRTFEAIESIITFGEGLEKFLPKVDSFLRTNISDLKNFLKSPACKYVIYITRLLKPHFQPNLPPDLRNAHVGLNDSLCDQLSTFLETDGSTDTLKQTLDSIKNVVSTVLPYIKCFNLNKFVGYPDQESLVNASFVDMQSNLFWSAVVFDGFDQDQVDLPSLIQYRIRMVTDKVDSTRRIMDKFWHPGNRGTIFDIRYWMFGFIYIQDMVDHAIIRLQTNQTQEPGVYTHQFPYGCYVHDTFTDTISSSLPLFMIISWIYTVAMIVKGVVYEKEQRLKEVMKIMGLGNGVHWLAWFITSMVMMLITVIIFVIILKAGKVLEYSDPSVVFVFMLAFTVSTISQCFLISVFFSKANLAAVCGGIIYFVLYLPYTQLDQWEDDIDTSERLLASLSSNIAMGYGCSYFSQYEEMTVGAQWHNIGESPMVDDTFNLAYCIGMMFLDSVIYLLLTWYIEAVFPGRYGMPRKFYFFLQKSYWCGHTHKVKNKSRADFEMSNEESIDSGVSEDFEKDPVNLKVGVAVRNLSKVYKKGDKIAVNDLTINFYEGQITSFLGHNGAGKTTTMSILTGLFPPTSGTAYIYGRDILSEIDEIRGGLGMCPQHNVLFDLLTVEEHIWFYARLKGRSEADVKHEMEQLIVDVGLPHKRKAKSMNLSGGMKRKLSVVIAFVGGSRTVILDEPTAGVDPYARRAIWKLLLKFKKDRTIILSTHHMDEADILGDRIAIISQGKLCTVGSSLFLKNRFGSGYYLTLVREDAEAASGLSGEDSLLPISRPSTASSIRTVRGVEIVLPGLDDEGYEDSPSLEFDDQLANTNLKKRLSGSNHSRLTALIQDHVPGAVLVEDNSMELCYRLPESESSADKYQKLFAALEKAHKDFGISSFGISDTSLEEVFLRVAAASSAADCKEDKKKECKDVLSNGSNQHTILKLKLDDMIKTSIFHLNYANKINPSEPLPAGVIVSDSNHSRLTALIQDHVPGAVLVEDNSTELCYSFPESESSADKYQKLFAALETSHKYFGISAKSLDQIRKVFLKDSSTTGCKEDKNKRNPKNALQNSVNSNPADPSPDVNFSGAGQVCVKGKRLLLQQLLALFLKRFHHVRRSKKGFISEILLPAGFVCLALVFALLVPSHKDEPALELQPWMYEPPKGDSSLYTFYSNDNPSNPISSALETEMLRAPYYGNRCMNSSLYTISEKPCQTSSDSHWTASPWFTGDVNIDSPACSCKSGFQRCPEKAGGREPSMLRIPTHDRLYNTTGRNLSDWLVKTVDKYQKRRYGGFSLGEENMLARLIEAKISPRINGFIRAVGNLSLEAETLLKNLKAVLKLSFTEDNVKVWFNNKGWASSVSYMNAMNNVLLRTRLPPGKDPQNYGIVTYNHPMNLTKAQLTYELLNKGTVDVVVAICIIFAMSFVPASFVLFLIEERVSNSKHLQFVSGIKPSVYWLANWAWDMINYAIPALLCVLIFLAFNKQAYVSAQNFPCLLALLFLYGWAITPMMYPFSRMFSVPSSAFVFLSCVNIFLGTVSTLGTFIMEAMSQEDKDLAKINENLKQVFLLLPHYCLGRGLIDMAFLQLQSDVRGRLGDHMTYDLFEWKVVGRNLFSMIMLGVGFNILNLLIEYRFFLSFFFRSKNPATVSKVTNEDIDVARERQRVVSGGADGDVLRLQGLTKVYWSPGSKGKLTAIDHLYIGVPKGQCFGLLGVNGAGKTTTFKMLTGDEQVTAGDAFLNQLSIRKKMVQVRQFMGYCPQFDALDPLLTGREHLEFFARVRGISPKDVKTVADWVMRRLGLAQHGDKISSSYSGGNKRKLSTAIALIGNPPIIFLDEPTTGMDPGARRFLWNCINSIVKAGRSVILTSHSMEECEALCNRLAIMVNGTFQCLGSIQHLKNRFGNGYTIILRVSSESLNVQPVMEFISSSFPSAKLRERHHNMLQYQLGNDSMSLSRIFQAMEEAKRVYNVEDYSVSQTTLDQVFISFATKQTDLLDEEVNESENIDSKDDLQDDKEEGNSSVLNAESWSNKVL